MNARAAILQRLRAAPRGPMPARPDVTAWVDAQRHDEPLAQRIDRLRAAMTAVRTEVVLAHAIDWAERAAALLQAKGVHRLALGHSAPGLALQAALRDVSVVRADTQAIEAWRDDLFDSVDAGFTTARSALADPGALVLWPDADQPRLLSLVPPLHLVWLDARTIHPDWPAALTAEAWAQGMPTNALLISGPSKTADIQQTLAYGAHGPRELVVFVVEGWA